jgi:hypothetical protein
MKIGSEKSMEIRNSVAAVSMTEGFDSQKWVELKEDEPLGLDFVENGISRASNRDVAID